MKFSHGSRNLMSLLILLLVSGCAAPVPTLPAAQGVTITLNPDNTSTPTPFLPAVDSPTPTLPPTQTPTPLPTSTPIPPTRMPAPETSRASYVLLVDLDYSAHHLSVDETIQYPNQTGSKLSSLILAVEPNRWLGVFQPNKLSVDGVETTDYSLEGGRMEVNLSNPLATKDVLNLRINYDLTLPWNGSDQIFGYNNWQINVVDWYPFVVPYSSSAGWLLHDPTSVGEHLVMDSVDFDVTIRQTDGSANLRIAASAPAETVGDGTHYTLKGARTFVFSASSAYLSSSATVGEITVTSYYADGNQTGGEAILNAVVQAIGVYSDAFAPFPYKSISIVETFFPDGMEYDGLFFLSQAFYNAYDGTLLNNLIMIGVHETAHQWWFGLVGNDQALEPWLDETLATYSEVIFYEHIKPGLVGYWWNFRVLDFQPAGKIDISIYEGGSFRPYTNAVYLRGAKFMENLHTRMGDEAFFAFLKDYAAQMSYKRASADDFFRILYTHTSADITDIVATYFQNNH
jgi:hypothetical protein